MELAKLSIKNEDIPEGDDNPFEVLFNPTEYSLEDGSDWEEQDAQGRTPELQFTGGQRKKLSMELFFDTYEQKTDVREHTERIADLLLVTVNKSNHGARPPVVTLGWGDGTFQSGFPFKGVLESLKQQFTLFTSSGTPVRAKLNVSFKEFRLPEEEIQENPTKDSFPARTYTVQAGDTPSRVAGQFWRDPQRWREIALNNDLDNPRLLVPGTILAIPAVE